MKAAGVKVMGQNICATRAIWSWSGLRDRDSQRNNIVLITGACMHSDHLAAKRINKAATIFIINNYITVFDSVLSLMSICMF